MSQANPPTNEPIARHLAAITREAAGRAYEADSATSGKITTWLMTVLTTLHAGGFLAALENTDKIASAFTVKAALLVGLISTLAGGVAGMAHYNFLAERWRQEMHMEIEGAAQVSAAAESHGNVADVFDKIASALLAISMVALGVAGAYAF